MALDIKRIPLEMAAVIGSIVLILTGCLHERLAYRSIDWVTIFLFAGMMPVATAMDKSGAGKLIADNVVALLGGQPSPYLLTAVLFILSAGLTQFMSNTASAALLCPIGISIAHSIGVSPHAVIMAIAIAASCAFATPVGTPPNTLVLEAGNYHFMDYVKAGTPLVIISCIVSVILIPIIWPF
jgi:di/tricarboxylate transporter